MGGSDDPLAGLLGSARRQAKSTNTDLGLGSKRQKTAGESGGLNPLDLLGLPPAQRDVINWLSRRKQSTLPQLAEALNKSQDELAKVLDDLKRDGSVREALVDGQILYRVAFGGKVSRSARGMPKNIWDAVDLDNALFLRQIPLFAHLEDEALQQLTAKLEVRHYHRNEVIAWQGNIDQDVMVIKNGIVGITRLLPGSASETQILAYLKQNDVVGEINLLLEQNVASTTTATALSEVDVLVLKRQAFLDYVTQDRKAAIELARLILQRLLATNDRLVHTGGETKLAMVFGIGEGSGETMLGCALAMTLAQVTQSKAVYTEHPSPDDLHAQFPDWGPHDELYHHAGMCELAAIKTSPGLPPTVRTTLVMDKLLSEYPNIVIGVPGVVDETVSYMLEQASQIIIVYSPEAVSHVKLIGLVEELRELLHPEKTNLFLVANHTKPDLFLETVPTRIDFEIPYLGAGINTLSAKSLEQLPPALSKVTDMLADRLGRTNQIGIYLPNTYENPDLDANSFVQETLSFLGSIFGGATATTTETQGTASDGTSVPETLHIVRTYVTKADLDRHLSQVLGFVEQLKLKVGQEALAIEVNAKLMLI